MLKFWKNTARGKTKYSSRPPEPQEERVSPCSTNDSDSPQHRSFNFENISESDPKIDITSHTSRLSKNLDETLADEHCLEHFEQYLDSVACSSFIEFWIENDNFKKAAETLATEKNKKTKHGCINRTVSFDSSITKSEIMKSKSSLNGFCDATKNNVDDVWPVQKYDTVYLHASCSNIINKNSIERATRISTKQELLHEAVRIFKKFIALESPQRLDIPEDIRNSIISSICHPEGLVEPNIFEVVQNLVYREMQKHFDSFLQSDYFCKYQVDILTSGTLTIEDILFNQMALFYFTEYLEQEHCTLILEFVLAVINFRDQLNNTETVDPDQAQNDAIILYDKYFSLQATSPLGFTGDVRLIIEENICKESGPQPDCFHIPFRLALKMLQQYMAAFLSSQLYYKYLSEMISTVDGSWHSSKHKKSYSDCSSEMSINARNTLLAMEDFPSHGKHKRQGSQASNMRIDSKQLYNGDLLWRRKTDKGLCLGRVNSLGRFESSMEPDPEKKDSSVIKRVVNKLVSGEKDKAKEELAWQVAHMIVKDITDVTMGIPENQL